jgi:TolB-like protein/Tfp pilus assembly protein PilF
MDQPQSTVTRIYEDLRRRKVFRAAALYGVFAWFVIQAAEATFEPLNLPQYTHRIVVIAALAGFPIVVLVAWAYDLTRRGLVRTSPEGAAAAASGGWRDRIIDFAVIAILAVLVVYLWMRPGAPSAGGARPRSIAVLPFDDFSEGRDQAYFGDGIAEELLNALVGVEGLRVAARTSSFAFRGQERDVRAIGEALDVETVLEGSVRRSGDRVKITAQLIETSNGYHLWSQVYDRQITDIFEVQEDISRSIAEELKLRLSPGSGSAERAGPTDVRAYDLYLLGRHHWRERTRESIERARQLFAEAVRLDPDYAAAYSGLADTYLLLSESQYGTLTQAEVLEHAEAAIARALELDGDLAEAYASLGLLRWSTGDLTLAELALRKAVDLNPNYSMAHTWLGSVLLEDRFALREAGEAYAKAYAIDPLQIVVANNHAQALGRLARADEARAVGMRLIEHQPESTKPYLLMADVEENAGRIDEAIRWLRRTGPLPGRDPTADLFLAKMYATLGDLDAARAAIAAAEQGGAEPHLARDAQALIAVIEQDWPGLARVAEALMPPAGAPPSGFAAQIARVAGFWDAIARLGLGDAAGAVAGFERLGLDAQAFGGSPGDLITARNAWAYALGRLGRDAEARAVLEETLVRAAGYRAAGWLPHTIGIPTGETYILLGRRDEGIAAIGEAIDAGARHLWYLKKLPTFDAVRDAPAFREALARLEAILERQRAAAGSSEG